MISLIAEAQPTNGWDALIALGSLALVAFFLWLLATKV